jgi:hypothetical protein
VAPLKVKVDALLVVPVVGPEMTGALGATAAATFCITVADTDPPRPVQLIWYVCVPRVIGVCVIVPDAPHLLRPDGHSVEIEVGDTCIRLQVEAPVDVHVMVWTPPWVVCDVFCVRVTFGAAAAKAAAVCRIGRVDAVAQEGPDIVTNINSNPPTIANPRSCDAI